MVAVVLLFNILSKSAHSNVRFQEKTAVYAQVINTSQPGINLRSRSANNGLTYYNNRTVAYAARPPALPDGCRRKKKSTFANFRQQIKIDKMPSAIEEKVNRAQILVVMNGLEGLVSSVALPAWERSVNRCIL